MDRARVRAAIRRTRVSSALSTATPPSAAAGSASTSSAFASSMASIEPSRERWTGWTAVTTPIDGRAIAARSRISPPAYMPISSTTASCSGPRSQHGQRQPHLVVPVALGAQCGEPAAEDRRHGLLGRGLGDGAGDAHDQRREARPPGRRHRLEGAERVGDQDNRDVSQRADGRLASREVWLPAHEHRRRAGTRRLGQEAVAVGPLAGQRHEQHPGLNEPRVHCTPAGRPRPALQQAAAGGGHQVVGAHAEGIGGRAGGIGRWPHGTGHWRECRTDAHGATWGGGGRTCVSGTRYGVVIASCAMRRNNSNDITGISSSPCRMTVGRTLLDSDRHHQVRMAGLARDVPDERVVEEVDLPVVLRRVPDLCRAGLAAHLESGDQGPGSGSTAPWTRRPASSW